MGKVTLDAALSEKLRAARESVEICDDAGVQLGIFHPTDLWKFERKLAYFRTKEGREELDRREAEPAPNKTWEQMKKEMGIE